MAERRHEMAHTLAALAAGEISEDQAAVVAAKAPPGYDSQMADLARATTVHDRSRWLHAHHIATCAGSTSTSRHPTEVGRHAGGRRPLGYLPVRNELCELRATFPAASMLSTR